MSGETRQNRWPLTSIGSGKPVLVLNGGPGLDKSYLVEPIKQLDTNVRFVLYDQIGTGENETDTEYGVDSQFAQLRDIIGELSNEAGLSLIAHSWGAYLAYLVINSSDHLPIDKIVLISPIGLTRGRFDESGEALINSMPANAVNYLEECYEKGDGVAFMNAALPYYMYGNDIRNYHIDYYSIDNYEKILASAADFDFTNITRDKVERYPIFAIYGEEDVENISGINEWRDIVELKTIPRAGHFCFFENSSSFSAVLKDIFNN